MKPFRLFALCFCFIFCQTAFSGNQAEKKLNKNACSYNGIPLKGKVKIVSSFPDVKVQVITSFPDIEVKTVTSFPDNCGEWQFVESFPDFTIQFVESFPDVKVKFVDSFPGMK
jgi:hypothetical protein